MSEPTHTSRPTDNPYRPYTQDAGTWERRRQNAIDKKRRDDHDFQQQLLNTRGGGSFQPRTGSGGAVGSGSGGGLLVIIVLGLVAVAVFQDDSPTPREDREPAPAIMPAPAPVPSYPATTPAPVEYAPPPAPMQLTVAAVHEHGFGDCEGVLTFTAGTVTYRTAHPEDSFSYAIADVALDGDGVRDASGKAWHFKAAGLDVAETFRQWHAGELFDTGRGEAARATSGDAPPATEPGPAPPPASSEAIPRDSRPDVREVRVAVRHKHRLRDCAGVLVFAADTVRFETDHPDDSFLYALRDVELHSDGFRDPAGKAWHFTSEGRDMRETFRRWKEGGKLAGELP